MQARTRIAVALSALASMALAGAGRVAAEPAIAWRVENPFRLFRNAADTEVHRATFLALPESQQQTSPILAAERALSLRHPDGWAGTMYRDICWDADRNRHVCELRVGYVNPTSHAVIAKLDAVEEADLLDCVWLTSGGTGGTPRGDAVRQPCREPIKLLVPYPEGLRVSVEIGGQPVVETTIQVRDVLIAGMGDSFASGEGNPDLPVRFSRERTAEYGKDDLTGYPARTGPWKSIGDKAFIKENARWVDQACHRSLYSHQLRAALQLAVEDPHRSVTFVGVACAGAEVTEGLFLRYKGNEWVPYPPDLSQLSFVADAQCGAINAPIEDAPETYHLRGRVPELKGGLDLRKCPAEQSRKIDLVFLSVGGNDIGFSRIVANAVLDNESTLRTIGGWFGESFTQVEATSKLSSLDDRYKTLNRAIRNILHIPWSQSDRILLTAYPGLALVGDGSQTCPSGQAGMDVISDFKMSETKVREGVWIADKLNRTMEKSANDHGWTFVSAHRAQFIGRGVCAGFVDNSFSVADDLRLPRKIDGKWLPYNPADFRAYASRQRWFRSPNDAFMTGNFHVPSSLVEKVLKLESFSWVQLLLASTYSGAFHPTAEGHAAIADALVKQARPVLAKYRDAAQDDEMPEPSSSDVGRLEDLDEISITP